MGKNEFQKSIIYNRNSNQIQDIHIAVSDVYDTF